MGPVDYFVVLFPGNKFNGKIAPEIARLERSGTIRIIDLIFIMKDANGKVTTIENRDLGGEAGEAFHQFSANIKEWFCLDDIEAIAETLPRSCSAVAILFENVWALKLKEAVIGSEGQLVTQGRIPHEIVMQVMKERILIGGA